MLFFFKQIGVYVKPVGSSLEAFQKLKPSTTIKDCRSFAGMVNYHNLYCPEVLIIKYKMVNRN